MIQYFRLVGFALFISVSMGSMVNGESNAALSTTFSRLTGVDLFGDDLTSKGFKGISLAECEDICLNDNSCRAYSFIKDTQWCFPKYGLGDEQKNTNVVSGIRSNHSFPYFSIAKATVDGIYDPIRQIFAEEQGIKYLIEPEEKSFWYELQIYKELEAVVDLDGDGIEEALLRTQQGGNCCGPIYFVIKRIKEGFYVILGHKELGSGWPDISIKETQNKRTLLVENVSDGADNTSLKSTLAELELIEGKLHLISKHANTALVYAELEVTSEELREIKNKVLEYDLDLDGIQDQLTCSYWERWGSATCVITTSKFGEVSLNRGCDRFGILKSVSNEMHDLVCNRTERIQWNQKNLEYVWPDE